MGRRKIEIQPITHERNRSVTFLKRKNGLFKKAYELGVLCSVDVAVIIFEERQGHHVKLHEYCSTNVDGMVNRHLHFDGERESKGPPDFNNKPDLGVDDDDDGGEEDEDGVKRGGMKGGNKAPARMLPANVKPGVGGAGGGAGMTGFSGLGAELDYARMSMPHTHNQSLHNLQIPGNSLTSTASPTSAYNQSALPVSLERSGGGNPHKRPRIDSNTGPGPGPYTTYGIDDSSGGTQSPSSYRLPHGGSGGGMFPPPNPGQGPHTPASPTNPAFFTPSSGGFGRPTAAGGRSSSAAGGGGGYGMYPPPQHQGASAANPFAALLGAGAPSSGSGSVSPHPHGSAAGYGGGHGHGGHSAHVEPLDWPVHGSPSSGGPGSGGGGPPSASSPHPHGFPTPSSARPSGAGGGGDGGGGGASNSWLDFLSNSSTSGPTGSGGGGGGSGGGGGGGGGGLLDELSRPASVTSSGARRAEDSWERGLSGGASSSPGLGKRGRSDSNVLKEEDVKGRPTSTQPDSKSS